MDNLIEYKTALLAKQKGFKTRTITTKFTNDYLLGGKNVMINENCISLWMYELQKWLREKHNVIIDVQLDQISYPKYCFNVYKYEDFGNWEDIDNPDWGLYSSYEKALKDALVLALQNVSETVA